MAIAFSAYNFTTKSDKDVHYVFDIIRKKWVVITPEEWVRQQVLHYLVTDMGYPPSLIAVERGLILNKKRKRFDVVVFNKSGNAHLMVECKRPEILINQEALDQIARYNAVFKAPYLWITNGSQHLIICYSPDFKTYAMLEKLPGY